MSDAPKVLRFAFGRTGFRGVYWDASKLCFKAEIGNRDRGTRKRLGNFATAGEAAEAYDIAAVAMYGSAAVLNFPLAGHQTVIACNEAPPSHCASGHAFDAANIYIDPIGRRQCRACNRTAVTSYQDRKKNEYPR